LYLWDTSTGRQIPRFKGRHQFRGLIYPWRQPNIIALALAPDGKILASGGEDGSLWLWDLSSGKAVYRLSQLDDGVSSIAFAPDGKTFAAADEGSALTWEVQSGRQIHWFAGPARCSVTGLSFSADRLTLAAKNTDGLSLWDVTTHEVRRKLAHPDVVWSVAFAPDGKILATGDYAGVIRIYELERGELVRKLAANGKRDEEASGITSFAFTPDGKTLASGGYDRIVTLWDLASGRERRHLVGHLGIVRSIAISPDGNTLASGSDDGTALRWDLTRDQQAIPAKPR